MGTLLRAAAALRFSAAALLPRCCDPWNAKAVRAARGAAFRLPLWRFDSWDDALAGAQAGGVAAVLGADPRGDPAAVLAAADVARGAPLWLALGAEGPGLSPEARRVCTPVAIPGAGETRQQRATRDAGAAALTGACSPAVQTAWRA